MHPEQENNNGDKQYKVHLENLFEGPMDLLIHLIKKNELDIYDIPVALITEQYLEYLSWMKMMNIDFAGEFLVMASTLAQIKSRMLLPIHEEDDQERCEASHGSPPVVSRPPATSASVTRSISPLCFT